MEPPPQEYIDKMTWVNHWLPRAEAGERLPFPRSQISEMLSEAREIIYAHMMRVQEAEKNSRAKSEKDQTEAEPRWYFGTFTQPDTNKSPHEILKNTVKVIKSKMVFPLISWCYSLELMKNGTPHTHFAFLTARRVEYSKVNAFNCSELKIKQRSETSAARYPQQAIDYVLKTDTKPSHEWLTENNLTQCIWKSDNCPGLVCPMSPGGPNIK